jgi:hypothetical protein
MQKYLQFSPHYRGRKGNFRVSTDNWGRRYYHLQVNGWNLTWYHTYQEAPYSERFFTPHWTCHISPVNKQDQFPEELSKALAREVRGTNTFKVYQPLLRLARQHKPVRGERGLPKIRQAEVDYIVRHYPTNYIAIIHRRGEIDKHYQVLGRRLELSAQPN